MPTIGLALGGGGARGLAHIRFLELLDELEIRPSVISACSMGAVIGALYASGCSGREIRDLVEQHSLHRGGTLREAWHKLVVILQSVTRLLPETRRGGLVNIDRLLGHLLEPLAGKNFDELDIPLVVVAADFWDAEEVVFSEGEVLRAIRASISIPGLFVPCKQDGRVLVDGGLVNELPYDHLVDRCDVTIAINVAGSRQPEERAMPSEFEASAGAIDILQASLLTEKLKRKRPELLVCPEICNIELLDFAKIDEIFEQCDASLDQFRRDLKDLGLTTNPDD